MRDRVTLISTAVLAVTLAIASIAGNLVLSNRFDRDVNDTLRNRAAAQQVTIEHNGEQIFVRESSNDEVLDDQSWVFDQQGAIVKPRASRAVNAAAESLKGVTVPTFVTINENIRLLGVPAASRNGDPQGTVVVGVSLRPYERTEHYARVVTFLIDLFALIAAALAVRWSVTRSLRPVEEMTERAAQWSDQDLDRRFELGEPYDEITGLAATLDQLLGRIDAAMRREQQLTAEIAHELRTPLAGIRAEAELARRSASDEERGPLDQIIASADRTNVAIETLLAAHSGANTADRWCDPEATVQNVADVSNGLANAQRIKLKINGLAAPRRVEIDENVLAQAVSPVLENAIRHAQSVVEISLSRVGSATVVRVQDDGEGFGDVDSEEFFSPGFSDDGGAGLGLPLARRLAHSFGGEWTGAVTTGGGAFELRVPDSREQ